MTELELYGKVVNINKQQSVSYKWPAQTEYKDLLT